MNYPCDEAGSDLALLREYAGPGPYECDIDGQRAPTWQELRELADHNFSLYANCAADLRAAQATIEAYQQEWIT